MSRKQQEPVTPECVHCREELYWNKFRERYEDMYGQLACSKSESGWHVRNT